MAAHFNDSQDFLQSELGTLEAEPQDWRDNREFLRKNWNLLQRNLVLHPLLLGVFYSEELLTEDDYDMLSTEPSILTKGEKIVKFLRHIQTKGPIATETLLSALDETQPQLSDELKKARITHDQEPPEVENVLRRGSTFADKLKITAGSELMKARELQIESKYDGASHHHVLALGLYRAAKDVAGEVECQCGLGVDYYNLKHTELFSSAIRDAVKLYQDRQSNRAEGIRMLLALSKAFNETGELIKAETYLHRCLGKCLAEYTDGSHLVTAGVHLCLAETYNQLKIPSQALRHAHKSLSMFEELFQYDNISPHKIERRNEGRARECLQLAMSSMRKIKPAATLSQELGKIGFTESGTHIYDDAEPAFPVIEDDDGEYVYLLNNMDIRGEWETPREFVTLVRRLRSGSICEVWKGKWNSIGVTIKKLKPGAMSIQAFKEQLALLQKCRHDKILKLYATCSIEDPILIISEFVSKGILLEYLEDKSNGLELNNLVHIATQVSRGMSYLEEQNIVHRNLSARNVLVGHDGIKIDVFGVAKFINEGADNSKEQCAAFPAKWTAPEAALSQKFTTKSDVWSFGILMVEIITRGNEPYPGMEKIDAIKYAQRGMVHRRPEGCPTELHGIMLKCWAFNPDMRPNFKILTNLLDVYYLSIHPHVEKVEYDEVSTWLEPC